MAQSEPVVKYWAKYFFEVKIMSLKDDNRVSARLEDDEIVMFRKIMNDEHLKQSALCRKLVMDGIKSYFDKVKTRQEKS